jgi:hypothetical protein
VDERSLESLLSYVFGIFPTPCIAEREPKNPLSVALDDRFECQVISSLRRSDQFFVPN